MHGESVVSEMMHVWKHIEKAENDFKSLDVKIMELRDEQDNLQLLYDIMALVI